MPLKIAISINACWNFLNFRKGLIQALLDAGHEVIAIAPRDAHSEQLERLGCRLVPIAIDSKGVSPARDLALCVSYRRILRRERPDVYLGYTIKPNLYGSLAAHSLGIPVINNVSGLGTAFIKTNWLTRLVELLYRAALSRSHTVFFQNEEDRALFVSRRLVAAARTRLLPGSGIDLAYFAPRPSEPDAGSGFTFLLIARLLADKGVREYAEAARIVRAAAPDTECRLLGFLNAANRTAITPEEVAGWEEEGAIRFLGDAADVRPHIAAADCVVLPSYREGLPRSLLEAAAMGKPLIATDVPGCRDIVEEGVNGVLCTVRDPRALAEAMLKMRAAPPQLIAAMGKASRRKAEEEFAESIVIDRYMEAISQALS